MGLFGAYEGSKPPLFPLFPFIRDPGPHFFFEICGARHFFPFFFFFFSPLPRISPFPLSSCNAVWRKKRAGEKINSLPAPKIRRPPSPFLSCPAGIYLLPKRQSEFPFPTTTRGTLPPPFLSPLPFFFFSFQQTTEKK